VSSERRCSHFLKRDIRDGKTQSKHAAADEEAVTAAAKVSTESRDIGRLQTRQSQVGRHRPALGRIADFTWRAFAASAKDGARETSHRVLRE
jgi:hypothetical protein